MIYKDNERVPVGLDFSCKNKNNFSQYNYVVVNGILIITSNLKGFFQDNDELNQFGEILDPFFFFFFNVF